jgi:Concanavalin A-like lectin/glucanases superfamily
MSVRFSAAGQYYSATTGLPASTVYSYVLWLYESVDRNDFSEIVSFGPNDNSLSTNADGTTLRIYPLDFGATALTGSTWYAVGVVVNGANLDFYTGLAANALTKQSTSSYVATTPTILRIGDYHGGGYWWNGRVAAFKLWQAALTQAEVEAELASYDAVRTSNLLRVHKLQVPETTDYSGNGNALTVTGSPSTEADPPIGAAPPALVPRLVNPNGGYF